MCSPSALGKTRSSRPIEVARVVSAVSVSATYRPIGTLRERRDFGRSGAAAGVALDDTDDVVS